MQHTFRRTIGYLGLALMSTQLFAAVNSSAVPGRTSSSAFEQAAPTTDAHREAGKLLKQISSQAAATSRSAEALESFTRPGQGLHLETHAGELTRAKEAINAMGRDLRQLQELRANALPWQQMIIDRIEPALAGMAGSATDAIEQLNEDRRAVLSDEYRETVRALYAQADTTRNLIAVNLDYAEAREKLNRLDASVVE